MELRTSEIRTDTDCPDGTTDVNSSNNGNNIN